MIWSFAARFRNIATSGAPLARIARNTGWLLVSKALGAVLSLIYLALATRGLGPARFGEFTLILGLAQAVASFVTFQTWRLILRLGTEPLLRGDRGKVARLIWFCLSIDLAGAAAGCLLVILLVRLLAPHFGWSPIMARHAIWFAFVLLLTVRSTAVGALRLHDRFRDGAIADTATPLTRMAGAVLVMIAGPSVDGFLWAWAAAEATTAIAYWFLVWRRVGPWLRGQTLRGILGAGGEHEGFWRFAIFTNLGSTLASASQQCTLLAVGYSVGDAAAGFFRLAHQLGQALLTFAEMLNRSLYAEMARIWARHGRDAMRDLLARTDRAAFAGGALVILIVLALGKTALHLIGGKAYLPAYPLLVLLGSAAAVQLAGVSFEPTLIARGRPGLVLTVRATAIVVLAPLLFVLMPRYHATGAAIAMLGDALVVTPLLGYASRRTLRARMTGDPH